MWHPNRRLASDDSCKASPGDPPGFSDHLSLPIPCSALVPDHFGVFSHFLLLVSSVCSPSSMAMAAEPMLTALITFTSLCAGRCGRGPHRTNACSTRKWPKLCHRAKRRSIVLMGLATRILGARSLAFSAQVLLECARMTFMNHCPPERRPCISFRFGGP